MKNKRPLTTTPKSYDNQTAKKLGQKVCWINVYLFLKKNT